MGRYLDYIWREERQRQNETTSPAFLCAAGAHPPELQRGPKVKPLHLETVIAPESFQPHRMEGSAEGYPAPHTAAKTAGPEALPVELAIVVPCLNESDNLHLLIPQIRAVISDLDIQADLWVVDGGSKDETTTIAARLGAQVIKSPYRGYGGALRAAFETVPSPYILTLDADLSHHPSIVKHLYEVRHQADIIIASRYIQGGYARTVLSRKILSRLLNLVFRSALSLPIHDLSSGFRLYHRGAVASLSLRHSTYAVLEEILAKAYCAGYRIAEIPFHYQPRQRGRSNARLLHFGLDYLALLGRLLRVRYRSASADYDTRAFHSLLPAKRMGQRHQYHAMLQYIGNRLRVLHVGCGSSQVLNGAPQAVGLDPCFPKLRFMRRPGRSLVNARTTCLPFLANSFEVVACFAQSEKLLRNGALLDECLRVLQEAGSLILSVPAPKPGWAGSLGALARASLNAKPRLNKARKTQWALRALLKSRKLEILDEQCRFGRWILHARKPHS